MVSSAPLGQMYIELGLDVSKFNPTLNGAKNAVKYFRTMLFRMVPKHISQAKYMTKVTPNTSQC